MSTILNFQNKLSNENIFIDETFDLTEQTVTVSFLKSNLVTFKNCTFNSKLLEFKNINNEILVIEFENCTFNCDVNFSHIVFDQLIFKNTQAIKSINIGTSGLKVKLNLFQFSNDSNIEKPELTTDFIVRNSEIDIIVIEYLNHIKGKFQFTGNTFGKSSSICSFNSSTITNVLFGSNSFLNLVLFKKVTFNSTSENRKPAGSAFEFPGFYKSNFVKVSFSESNFNDSFQFENCDFLSTIWFENCKNSNQSKLKFLACEFKGFSLFNKSKLHVLDISRCTFAKSSSFTDAVFDTLILFEVKFGGGAYFDEMKIKKVLNKSYLKDKSKILQWKRTLRAIKQELQKTENKIDFNTYRNYELTAHYKELNFSENFKDASILWATKWSSNFGNWFWAFCFTVIIGAVFFSSFYISENIHKTVNLNSWADFIFGYFRFFLITDFKNEYYESGESILKFNCFISLFPFIIGKIAVAFGLYEMIQSFRKFKA